MVLHSHTFVWCAIITIISIAAIENLDYTALSTSVSFTPGTRIKCVNISILNNLELNGQRSFSVELTASHSSITVLNTMATIFIIDDEG